MEVELKYQLVSSQQAEAILADPNCERPTRTLQSEPEYQRLFSLYVDSRDRRLARAHIALRLRSTNETIFFLTCKYAGNVHGALHQRGEDEVLLFNPAHFETIDPSQWPELIAPLLPRLKAYPLVQQALGDAELCERMRTAFVRRTRLLHWNVTRIELAVDEGEILVGSHREPLFELELELKDGRIEDLFACGDYLRQRYELVAESRSKLERGQHLFE